MTSCDQYRGRFWDYVYGLLEAEDEQSLRTHLALCSVCQGEVEVVEARRAALREALLLDIEVPRFVPPSLDTVPSPASRQAALARMASWSWVAVAAAVLLAVSAGHFVFERGLASRQDVLAETQKRLLEIQEQRLDTPEKISKAVVHLVHSTRSKQMRLEVFGPSRYHPGLASPFRLVTSDLNGQPIKAAVGVCVKGRDQRVLFQTKDLFSDGALLVSLPGDVDLRANGPARLSVSAQADLVREEVEGRLDVYEPVYSTHLVLDKPLYRPGDSVFFRSVTLDRLTLRPLEKDRAVRYNLYDPKGKSVQVISGSTHARGIGGGDFLIDVSKHSAGEYTLTAADPEGRSPPQSRKFLVQHPPRLRKVLDLQRNTYVPGDTLEAKLQVSRMDSGNAHFGFPVTASLEVAGRPIVPRLDLKTDNAGAVDIRFVIPKEIQPGDLRLAVIVGDLSNRSEFVSRMVPLMDSTALKVEFFPEGGDLVAGVPNRVYYQGTGDVTGRIVDSQGREAASLGSTGARGVFTLIPRAGESYSLQATAKDPGDKADLKLPPVRNSGVVLNVPKAVARPEDPLEVLVHQNGLEGLPVVITATCRGQLVAHETSRLNNAKTEIQLRAGALAHGVIRITVYDSQSAQLRPLAERLVYRPPAKRLNLAVQPASEAHGPGDSVHLNIRSVNEKGEPEPAWLLVYVVDKDAKDRIHDPAQGSLHAHFLLLNELRGPEDLEWSEMLLKDTPQAAAALDVFLATQGWRRFSSERPAGLTTKAPGNGQHVLKEDPSPILKLDNRKDVERNYMAALANGESSLVVEQKALNDEESRLLDAADAAAAEIGSYQDRAANYARLGTGAVALGMLGLGSLVLLTIVRRAWQEAATNMTQYVTAAAALSVGVVAVLGLLLGWPDLPGIVVRTVTVPVVQRPADTNVELVFRIPRTGLEQRLVPELRGVAEARAVVSGLRFRDEQSSPPGRAPSFGPSQFMIGSLLHALGDEPNPLPLRSYAFNRLNMKGAQPETILWHPKLESENGTASLDFDLPMTGKSYQIFVHGHTDSGRLGAGERTLEVMPRAEKK